MSVDYRGRLVTLMNQTLADENARHDWIYHAVRPMPVPPSWSAGQHVVGDCSKGVQYLCKWAGVPRDPMNENWDAWGNSSTLCAKLPHLSRASDLLPGDFVTFGSGGSEHATMVLQAGVDPLLWSFGHQGAPNSYRLSQDRREQQYLRNILPEYVPTGDDRLRALTTYWAWLQWTLGEGDWAHKVEYDAAVRPNVPKLIPPDWWKKRATFLLNRKKANTKPA